MARPPKEKPESTVQARIAAFSDPSDAELYPKPKSPAERNVLTKTMIDQLCRAMDIPLTLEDACRVVGVAHRAVKRWLSEAEDEECVDELKLELSRRIASMNSTGVRRAVMQLNLEHAEFDARTASKLLEQLNSSMRVEKQVKTTIEATVTPKPAVDYSGLTTEELQLLDQLTTKAALAAQNK